MKNKLVTYPALITPDENQTFDVEFIDVPEALSFGTSVTDAALHGQEALGLALAGKKKLPTPTDLENIDVQDNQTIMIISVGLEAFKARIKPPLVRKNVTVPADLAEQAQAKGINFSAVLSDALRAKLEA